MEFSEDEVYEESTEDNKVGDVNLQLDNSQCQRQTYLFSATLSMGDDVILSECL